MHVVETFGNLRTIPSPRMTALMLELLQLTPADVLMEIGTGSGEQLMAFEQTGAEIHTIELQPFFPPCDHTGSQVYLHAGDGKEGLPRYAPFTAIVATCGCAEIPKAWIEQLAENGRLLVPLGDVTSQKLTLFRKVDGELHPVKVAAYTRFQMMRDKPKSNPIKPVYKENDYGRAI